MSRREERRAAEAYVALIYDDWDEEEQAMMVDLLCDDESDEPEEGSGSGVSATKRVPRLPAASSEELAWQISADMTAALARLRAAAEENS